MKYLLRSWRMDDMVGLELFASNERLSRYMPGGFPCPFTKEDAAAYISERNFESTTLFSTALEIESRVVGGIDMIRNGPYEKTGELVFWIAEEFWNRGVMSQALQEFTKLVIRNFGMKQLSARSFVQNYGAAIVLTRAGFQREAVVAHGIFLTSADPFGRYADTKPHYSDLEIFAWYSEPIRAGCGDLCSECPRYQAETKEQLEAVARLWKKAGFREEVESAEAMYCPGCSHERTCSYGIVECIHEHNVLKCSNCSEYPCSRIKEMLLRSAASDTYCRKACTDEEYKTLEKAFFHKEENL